jgi:hypothetical protein
VRPCRRVPRDPAGRGRPRSASASTRCARGRRARRRPTRRDTSGPSAAVGAAALRGSARPRRRRARGSSAARKAGPRPDKNSSGGSGKSRLKTGSAANGRITVAKTLTTPRAGGRTALEPTVATRPRTAPTTPLSMSDPIREPCARPRAPSRVTSASGGESSAGGSVRSRT